MDKFTRRIGLFVVLAVSVLLLASAGLVSSPARAQDDQKKVIQKTTDDSGFEKQLTEVDLMHQTASQYMSAGMWEQAVAELQNVVAAAPDRLEGWQDLAKCYKQLKQYDKAAQAYQSAVGLRPSNLDLLSNLGFTQLNAGMTDAALQTYKRMLELDAVNYDANVHLGFIYQQANDNANAALYYENALQGNGSDVQTMGSLAKIYQDVGDTQKSVAMYERAIAAATDVPQKTLLQSKLGAALIQEKNYQKSAEVFGALVESAPDNAAYRFNLGISLMQMNKHKDAAPQMEKVIEIRPDYVQAYQQLAACYNETGRFDQAIATVKKGLPLTDEKGGLYCMWGRSLEKMKLFDEAMDVFQRAVDDPQWGTYARKQIQRQIDLKKREELIREQQGM